MTGLLDDAIARTGGPVQDFLRELKRMIEQVRPAALDDATSEATVNRHGVDLKLAHAHDDDWSIWLSAEEKQIIVGVGSMHEHFDPAWLEDDERPWTTQAVDMVAELLRGEIEIHTTYRGKNVAYVDHFLVAPDGGRESLGRTGMTAGLALWRPKRTEVERVSFDPAG